MSFDHRKSLMKEIEELRGGRRLVALCNFDRQEDPPNLGANVQFAADLKEPLFRVLKETVSPGDKIDVFLYTRGGETNAVWPVVSLIREFDSDFEVLIAFRAHSSGTLLSLGAKKLVMGPMSELSPIDPTCGNHFNPRDEITKVHQGISVEDVSAYIDFLKKTLGAKPDEECSPEIYTLMQPYLAALTSSVHPLALGNVQRVMMQIRTLAKSVLRLHFTDEARIDVMINQLTTEYYSHSHMINRYEAKAILGEEHVDFADSSLASKMDQLLRLYEDDFALRMPFYLNRFMENDHEKEARLIGGCVESRTWGYLYESKLRIRQTLAAHPNFQIQLQPGQTPPLVPGMPRNYQCEVVSRTWIRNKMPVGVSV